LRKMTEQINSSLSDRKESQY